MDLHTIADISAILTCVFVIVGYAKYQFDLHSKSKKLEAYLATKPGGKPLHTSYNIISALGLTEQEMIQISFRNKHVACRVHVDPATRKADELLFEWVKDKKMLRQTREASAP